MKGRDFAFVFKKTIAVDSHKGEIDSGGEINLGAGTLRPRTDNAELTMPILPRPIVQEGAVAVETEPVKVWLDVMGF